MVIATARRYARRTRAARNTPLPSLWYEKGFDLLVLLNAASNGPAWISRWRNPVEGKRSAFVQAIETFDEAVPNDVPDIRHAEPLHHCSGSAIVHLRERNDLRGPEFGEGKGQTRVANFGRQAAAPERSEKRPSDLEAPVPVERPPRQASTSDKETVDAVIDQPLGHTMLLPVRLERARTSQRVLTSPPRFVDEVLGDCGIAMECPQIVGALAGNRFESKSLRETGPGDHCFAPYPAVNSAAAAFVDTDFAAPLTA